MQALLKISDVARILGVTPGTVQQYAKQGKLDVIELSDTDFRVEPSELHRFINDRKRSARCGGFKPKIPGLNPSNDDDPENNHPDPGERVFRPIIPPAPDPYDKLEEDGETVFTAHISEQEKIPSSSEVFKPRPPTVEEYFAEIQARRQEV